MRAVVRNGQGKPLLSNPPPWFVKIIPHRWLVLELSCIPAEKECPRAAGGTAG